VTPERRAKIANGAAFHDKACDAYRENRVDLEPVCSCYRDERRELLAEVARLEHELAECRDHHESLASVTTRWTTTAATETTMTPERRAEIASIHVEATRGKLDGEEFSTTLTARGQAWEKLLPAVPELLEEVERLDREAEVAHMKLKRGPYPRCPECGGDQRPHRVRPDGAPVLRCDKCDVDSVGARSDVGMVADCALAERDAAQAGVRELCAVLRECRLSVDMLVLDRVEAALASWVGWDESDIAKELAPWPPSPSR